jgi:hypothetical protein
MINKAGGEDKKTQNQQTVVGIARNAKIIRILLSLSFHFFIFFVLFSFIITASYTIRSNKKYKLN